MHFYDTSISLLRCDAVSPLGRRLLFDPLMDGARVEQRPNLAFNVTSSSSWSNEASLPQMCESARVTNLG